MLIQVNETTVFLYGNSKLKHKTKVTDLRCFEKSGLMFKSNTKSK